MLSYLSILLLCAASASAECPQIQDLPILYDDDTFLCAEIWQGPGDDDLIQVIIEILKKAFLEGVLKCFFPSLFLFIHFLMLS